MLRYDQACSRVGKEIDDTMVHARKGRAGGTGVPSAFEGTKNGNRFLDACFPGSKTLFDKPDETEF